MEGEEARRREERRAWTNCYCLCFCVKEYNDEPAKDRGLERGKKDSSIKDGN